MFLCSCFLRCFQIFTKKALTDTKFYGNIDEQNKLYIFIIAHFIFQKNDGNSKFIDRNHPISKSEDKSVKAEYIKLLNVGREKVGNYWNSIDRYRNRLYYINGGKGGYTKNGERINFEHGMLYLIPYYANTITFTDPEDDLDHTYVDFFSTPPIFSTEVLQIDPKSSDQIYAALTVLCKLTERKYVYRLKCPPDPQRENELSYLSATTAYLTGELLKRSDNCIIKDQTVISALNMMTENLDTPITVAEIAQKHHMSVNGFIKLFSKCVGKTPYSYLKDLRIQKALMMRNEGVSLEKTAEACGYSDASALLHAINSKTNRKLK